MDFLRLLAVVSFMALAGCATGYYEPAPPQPTSMNMKYLNSAQCPWGYTEVLDLGVRAGPVDYRFVDQAFQNRNGWGRSMSGVREQSRQTFTKQLVCNNIRTKQDHLCVQTLDVWYQAQGGFRDSRGAVRLNERPRPMNCRVTGPAR